MANETFSTALILGRWDRSLRVDFTEPIFFTEFVYCSGPRRPVQDYTTVIKPLTPYVWLWTIVFILVTLAALAVAHEVYSNSHSQQLQNQEKLGEKWFAVVSGLLENHYKIFENPIGLVSENNKCTGI